MKWLFISPETVNPAVFGLREVYALKVARYAGEEVRCFSLKGWITFADLTDINPLSGEKLNDSEWFVLAAKGNKKGG
jgi:hypothetical protein